VTARAIAGEVVRVDRFGNLITNIDRPAFERFLADGPVTIRVGALALPKVVETYTAAPPGTICALFGSSNHLEIAANGANAAERLAMGRGAAVRLERGNICGP
jgi:S-adenosylmethionine hydrolase